MDREVRSVQDSVEKLHISRSRVQLSHDQEGGTKLAEGDLQSIRSRLGFNAVMEDPIPVTDPIQINNKAVQTLGVNLEKVLRKQFPDMVDKKRKPKASILSRHPHGDRKTTQFDYWKWALRRGLILGTLNNGRRELDAKQEAEKEKIKSMVGKERKTRGEAGSEYDMCQPWVAPEPSELKGKRIDVLWPTPGGKEGEEKKEWCQGLVEEVLVDPKEEGNEDEFDATVLWDATPDLEGFELASRDTVMLKVSHFKTRYNFGWRMDMGFELIENVEDVANMMEEEDDVDDDESDDEDEDDEFEEIAGDNPDIFDVDIDEEWD